MTPAQIDFTVRTLAAVKNRDAARLARGSAIRELLHKQLKLGMAPEHYRLEWINRSIGRVIDTLGQVAAEFDREHPDDKASVNDFADILASTMLTLQRATRS